MRTFISAHKHNRSIDLGQEGKPRSSSEKQHIDPMPIEDVTDEGRYYRSAEFQQALLEDQIERTMATPMETPEETNHHTWHRRLSSIGMLNTTGASKSSSSLPMLDYEAERARQLAEARSRQPPPDIEPSRPSFEPMPTPEHEETVPQIAFTDESTKEKTADGPEFGASHDRKPSRPSLHTGGLKPLFTSVRNSIYGKKHRATRSIS